MRSSLRRLLPASVLLCLNVMAVAADELPIPADEFVYCSTCHGVQLMGNPILEAPRLSGMAAWYVEQQMRSFKDGWRGTHDTDLAGRDMQPMAAALSDKQIREVAEYVSQTRSGPPETTLPGNVEKGRALYASCSACHGQKGEGVESLRGPALANLNDWYLVTQMQHFRDGSRGSHPEDRYGMQMRAPAQSMTDENAIMDVISYISTLRHE